MEKGDLLFFILSFLIGVICASLFFIHLLRKKNKILDTDQVTGLPNQNGLIKRILKCAGDPKPYVVFLIDLNNFREHNKNGYEFGDKKLIEFATLLKETVSTLAFIARFRAGDEFIVLSSVENKNEVRSVLDRLSCMKNEINHRGLFFYGEAEGILSHGNYKNVIHSAENQLIRKKEKKPIE